MTHSQALDALAKIELELAKYKTIAKGGAKTKEQIFEAVETAFDLQNIAGKSKREPYPSARQAAALLMYENGIGYSDIGRALNRHHSTALYSVREAKTRESDFDPQFLLKMQTIRRTLEAG